MHSIARYDVSIPASPVLAADFFCGRYLLKRQFYFGNKVFYYYLSDLNSFSEYSYVAKIAAWAGAARAAVIPHPLYNPFMPSLLYTYRNV
jgi:hypothetical protein